MKLILFLLLSIPAFAEKCPTRANVPDHYQATPKTLQEHLAWASHLTKNESCSRSEVVQLLAELDERHREFEMKALQKTRDGTYPKKGDRDHLIAVIYLKLANAVKLRLDLLDRARPNASESGAQ